MSLNGLYQGIVKGGSGLLKVVEQGSSTVVKDVSSAGQFLTKNGFITVPQVNLNYQQQNSAGRLTNAQQIKTAKVVSGGAFIPGPEGEGITAVDFFASTAREGTPALDNFLARLAGQGVVPDVIDSAPASIFSRLGADASGAANVVVKAVKGIGGFLKPGLSVASKVFIPAGILGAGAYIGATAIGQGATNLGAGLDYLIGKTPPTAPTTVPFLSNAFPGVPIPGLPNSPGGSGGGAPTAISSSGGSGPTGGSNPSPLGSLLGNLSGFDLLAALAIAGFVVYEITKKPAIGVVTT